MGLLVATGVLPASMATLLRLYDVWEYGYPAVDVGLVTDADADGGNGTLAAVVARELVDRGVGGTGYTTLGGIGAS